MRRAVDGGEGVQAGTPQGDEPTWHPLGPLDLLPGAGSEHVLVGLDLPPVATLRKAVAAFAAAHPSVFRVVDQLGRRWRPLEPGEVDQAATCLVSTSNATSPTAGLVTLAAVPPVGLNARIIRGDGWLGIAFANRAHVDDAAIVNILAGLLSTAATDPEPSRDWSPTLGSTDDDAPIAPTAPERALEARLRRLAGPRNPATSPCPSAEERPVVSWATSEPGFLPRLHAIAREQGEDVSIESVVLVGVRAALAGRGMTPAPGAEMTFDLRRWFPYFSASYGIARARIHVLPDDDYSPASVSACLHRVPTGALPWDRVFPQGGAPGRAAKPDWDRAPTRASDRASAALDELPAPRLAFGFMDATSPLGQLPWQSGMPNLTLERSTPEHPDGMTVRARHVGGRLSLSVSHYGSRWWSRSVTESLRSFLADPAGVIDLAQPEGWARAH